MTVKRLDWYKNKLISIFGGVKIINKNGYYIFISEKRNNIPSNKIKQRLKKEMKINMKNKKRIKKL